MRIEGGATLSELPDENNRVIYPMDNVITRPSIRYGATLVAVFIQFMLRYSFANVI